MRLRVVVALLSGAAFIACGGAPPPKPPPQPSVDEVETAPEESAPEPPTTLTTTLSSEKAPPPSPSSTASYDEALSTPEPLNVNDDRAHLTDTQLTGPVRGIINSCRVPANARVNIKTAVQDGRAIGVTVTVRIERPKSSSKSKRPPSKATIKADAKMSAKIVACVDRAVRAQSWPPSKRRDSFTTDF